MTKRDPKAKLEVPTRAPRAKGGMFENLRKPGEVESIPFEELVTPLRPEIASSPETASTLVATSSPAIPSSPEVEPPVALQSARPEVVSSPEAISAPAGTLADYAASLPYGAGHLRLNNDYFDKVLTLLSDLEQLLFIHVLRYREGKSDHTILLNFPLLESRIHVSTRTLGKVAASLERKGLVARYDYTFRKGDRQGFRFRIVMPSGLVAASSPEPASGPAATSDNKRVKEQSKRTKKRDSSNCPDCFGTGMYYPEGYEKGVARCPHSKLTN